MWLDYSDGRLVPPPSRIWATLVELTAAGELQRHIMVTVARVAAGFAVGVVAGSTRRRDHGLFGLDVVRLLDPTLQALRADPVDRLGAAVHPVARHFRVPPRSRSSRSVYSSRSISA